MDTDKRLHPITLCRQADTILCGGYALCELKDKLKIKDIDDHCIPSVNSLKNGSKQEFRYPWDIIVQNKKIIKENLNYRIKTDVTLNEYKKGVYVGKNVEIDPSTVFELEDDDFIVIEENTVIQPFVYFVGSNFIGKNTKIMAHSQIKDGTSIGCHCKVGGEIESSVISNYTNKQHYGYIGNSFIGEWVNMGAGTTNSDLKNTYGTVTIKYNNQCTDTGEQFIGCMIGDYTKMAINTSIYTGKIIGVNSHIYGLVQSHIPSFIAYKKPLGLKNEEFYIDKAIEVQKRMFSRRQVSQTEKDIDILRRVFGETQKDRNDFLKYG